MSDPDTRHETRHFGLNPEQIKEKDELVRSSHAQGDQKRKAEAIPAKLSGQEQKLLQNAEQVTRDFLIDKITRLDLKPPTDFARYPEIIYTQPVTNHVDQEGIAQDNTRGGRFGFGASFAEVAIDRSRDLLATALTAGHELSHAAAKQQWRFAWSNESMFVRIAAGTGLDRRHPGGKFFGGLENGLAYMDKADLYRLPSLQRIFPVEVHRRRKLAENDRIASDYKNSIPSMFGPIPGDDIEAFVSIVDTLRGKRMQFDSMPIKNYRFVQEVCRTLGFVLTAGHTGSNNELVQIGREILDRDQYTGNTDGLKMIVHVFGRERARQIFQVDDQYSHLDEAMQKVRDTQRDFGLPFFGQPAALQLH